MDVPENVYYFSARGRGRGSPRRGGRGGGRDFLLKIPGGGRAGGGGGGEGPGGCLRGMGAGGTFFVRTEIPTKM